MGLDGLPHQGVVTSDGRAHLVREALPETCAALDVGKQKSDKPFRKGMHLKFPSCIARFLLVYCRRPAAFPPYGARAERLRSIVAQRSRVDDSHGDRETGGVRRRSEKVIDELIDDKLF